MFEEIMREKGKETNHDGGTRALSDGVMKEEVEVDFKRT